MSAAWKNLWSKFINSINIKHNSIIQVFKKTRWSTKYEDKQYLTIKLLLWYLFINLSLNGLYNKFDNFLRSIKTFNITIFKLKIKKDWPYWNQQLQSKNDIQLLEICEKIQIHDEIYFPKSFFFVTFISCLLGSIFIWSFSSITHSTAPITLFSGIPPSSNMTDIQLMAVDNN